MKSRISFLVIIIVFTLVLGGNLTKPADAASNKQLIAPVVVEINSEPVYETELLYFLIGRYGQQVLAELIENAILAQKAGEYGVTIDPDLPKQEMLKKYGEEKFKELSEAFDVKKILNAVRRERLAEKVYDELVLKIIDEKGFEISQEEALDYFLKNSEQWSRPAMVRFNIIVTESKEDAEMRMLN
ncbi:MAG: hypothetical protein ABIG42_09075 [bacterium]